MISRTRQPGPVFRIGSCLHNRQSVPSLKQMSSEQRQPVSISGFTELEGLFDGSGEEFGRILEEFGLPPSRDPIVEIAYQHCRRLLVELIGLRRRVLQIGSPDTVGTDIRSSTGKSCLHASHTCHPVSLSGAPPVPAGTSVRNSPNPK